MYWWEKDFKKQILNRGQEYYLGNRVLNLDKKCRNIYESTVKGSGGNYSVSILCGPHRSLIMSCNCPSAEKENCKHMAAVLYKIEENDPEFFLTGNQHDTPKTNFMDFEQLPENSFFSLKPVFEKYRYDHNDFLKARELVDGKSIEISSVSTSYGAKGDNAIYFTAKSKIDGLDEVILNFTRSRILEFKCHRSTYNTVCKESDRTAYSYGIQSFPKLCVHKLAMLILADDYIRRENPGDYTDSNGKELVDLISKSTRTNVVKAEISELTVQTSEKQIIDIVPYLKEGYYGNYYISCLIKKESADKSYHLKDFVAFIRAINQNDKITFGKDLTLDSSIDVFTERGEKCLNFIKNFLSFSNSFSFTAKEILLGEDLIDLFYQTFSDTQVLDISMCPITFSEEKIKINSEVKPFKVADKVQGLTISFKIPKVVFGTKGVYKFLPAESKLVKTALKDVGPLKGIIRNSINISNYTCTLGMNQMRDFYTRVLPALKYYGNVDMSSCSALPNMEYAAPEFTFNLDYDQKQAVCTSTVSYGNEVYKLDKTNLNAAERDKTVENSVEEQLNAFFSSRNENIWSESDSDKIYFLISQGLQVLMDMGTVNVTDSFNSLKCHQTIKASTSITLESNLLELDIQTDDMTADELLELIASYKKHKVYHRLRNGSFVDLNAIEVKDLIEFFAALEVNNKSFIKGKIKIPAFRSLYLSELLKSRETIAVKKDASFRKLVRDFESFKDSQAEVPQTLKSVLRPYQEDGYRWLSTLSDYNFGGILADEMGLGKTLQVLSFILSRKENDKKGPSLIVCPASLIYNWEAEVKKFTPPLSDIVIAGKQAERESLIAKCKKYDLVITSYDLLKRDISDYQDIDFDCFIIDEAQFIKNSNTEASKAVKTINSKLRFALTGTPIENRLSELWSVFDFLMPSFLYGKEAFRKDFEIPIMKAQNSIQMDKLKKMVSPFILRRLKTDVLKELPEKIEENRFAMLTGEQRKLYDAQVVRIKKELGKKKESDFNTGKIEILAELTKLRQICCDPSLIFECNTEKSAKRELCIDLIKSAYDGGHKVLVFSQFTTMLNLLEKDLTEEGLEYYKIEGSTDKLKRLELVDAFNQNDVPVFLISLKAGGTGLNLTGADIVIHYDPWWNVAVQNQATDRAHRIGQKNVVSVYRLIAKDTIEEKIVALQERKKDLAEEVLSAESVSLSSLTKEDILEILG